MWKKIGYHYDVMMTSSTVGKFWPIFAKIRVFPSQFSPRRKRFGSKCSHFAFVAYIHKSSSSLKGGGRAHPSKWIAKTHGRTDRHTTLKKGWHYGYGQASMGIYAPQAFHWQQRRGEYQWAMKAQWQNPAYRDIADWQNESYFWQPNLKKQRNIFLATEFWKNIQKILKTLINTNTY